ncbi:UNVERIFIED_CONTAM: hypothetical protein FKN15_053404 [Acipenser sinensis]
MRYLCSAYAMRATCTALLASNVPDALRSGSVNCVLCALCVTFGKEQRTHAHCMRCEYRSAYTAYWEPSTVCVTLLHWRRIIRSLCQENQAIRVPRYRSTGKDATQKII